MPHSSQFESLLGRISARWGTENPGEPKKSTEVNPKTAPADGTDDYVFPSSWDWLAKETRLLRSRRGMSAEYDEMDERSPAFNAALYIIANNAAQPEKDTDPAITILSPDPRVVNVLNQVIDDLNLNDELWDISRDIAKYGERAEEVVVVQDHGGTPRISRLKTLKSFSIFPNRDKSGAPLDPPYKQVDDAGKTVAEFQDWQLLHFKNTKGRQDQFGTGVGYSAREIWKRLRWMEDAVAIARLTRAHNRLAFGVDTGTMTPEQSYVHVQKVRNDMRKPRTMDPRTGRMDTSRNPLAIEQDLFYSVNKDSKADIKTLQGDLTIGNLEDLLLFYGLIYTAMHVPKAYLSQEKDAKTRGIITEQDVQFARMVRRIQRVMIRGLKQLFDLALMLKGLSPDAVEYTIVLPKVAVVDELRKWQATQVKVLVATLLKQSFWPADEWILEHIFEMTPKDIAVFVKGQVKPDKYNGLYVPPKPPGEVAQDAQGVKARAANEALSTYLRTADFDDEDPGQVLTLLKTLRASSQTAD